MKKMSAIQTINQSETGDGCLQQTIMNGMS